MISGLGRTFGVVNGVGHCEMMRRLLKLAISRSASVKVTPMVETPTRAFGLIA